MTSARTMARNAIMRCGKPKRSGVGTCRMPAGTNTKHEGFGPCRIHGQAKEHRAWEMAMDVARELSISPWEALLKAVRLSAGRVAWVDEQLREATMRNDGGESAPEVRMWLKESREERRHMAQVSKAAIDAGVAERLVRNVEMEGRLIAEVVGRTLDALDLAPEVRVRAFEVAHHQLLVLEAPSATPVDIQGTWSPPGVVDPGVADGGTPGRSEEEGGQDGGSGAV